MISKTIGFRGTQHFQTHPFDLCTSSKWNPVQFPGHDGHIVGSLWRSLCSGAVRGDGWPGWRSLFAGFCACHWDITYITCIAYMTYIAYITYVAFITYITCIYICVCQCFNNKDRKSKPQGYTHGFPTI